MVPSRTLFMSGERARGGRARAAKIREQREAARALAEERLLSGGETLARALRVVREPAEGCGSGAGHRSTGLGPSAQSLPPALAVT